MSKLDEIVTALDAATQTEQELMRLLTRIHNMLLAAQRPGDAAQMQSIIDRMTANTQAMTAAIVENAEPVI